jgi:hypothetical protein
MLRVYDPKNVIITFATLPLKGFADGTFLVIEPLSDDYTWMTGADGEVARAQSMDNRHTARLTLIQTSDSNDVLSAVRLLGRRSSNGADVGVFTVKDLSGRTVVEEPSCFILRPPNLELGKELGPREWVLGLPDPNIFIGGNA